MATINRRTRLIVVWVGFLGLLLAVSPRQDRSDGTAPAIVNLCAAPGAGRAGCHLLRRASQSSTAAPDLLATIFTGLPSISGLGRIVAAAQFIGYGPADIQAAYNLGPSGFNIPLVAVVTAFDAPNAESDLARYRAFYGLPPCTSVNGCFRKINQSGQAAPLPPPETGGVRGWATEASVDIEMVSAACPACGILLVEADDDQGNGLIIANAGAVQSGVAAIVDSWGTTEEEGDTQTGESYFMHPGVAVVAAGGDQGYDLRLFPATLPYVTAVGGTSLVRADNARGWNETVWGSATSFVGTGSSCSTVEPREPYQTGACSHRAANDVSAVADPATGVAAFATDGGWGIYGSTGIAAAIMGGVYGLAATHTAPKPQEFPVTYLYDTPSALNDVTVGANGLCNGSYLCTAEPGYDGPTGLGTPNGIAAFTPPADDFAINVAPAKARLLPGHVKNVSIAFPRISGADETLDVTATSSSALDVSLSAPNVVTGGSLTLTIAADSNISQTVEYLVRVAAHGTTYHWTDYHVLVSPFPRPKITLTVTPAMIALSGSAVLQWSTTNATSCDAHATPAAARWHGFKNGTGSRVVTPQTAGVHSYELVCTGDGGTSHKHVELQVVTQPPIVLMQLVPATASPGDMVTLAWSAQNATACSASGAWSGSEPIFGSEQFAAPSPGTYHYKLKCTGPIGASSTTETLTVTAASGNPGVN